MLQEGHHCSCSQEAKVTELNDHRPVALTSVIRKVVKDHITSTLPDTLDTHQFAYRPNSPQT
ncbi:unnamed protein product, partial [Oncorhynchus mykiss]